MPPTLDISRSSSISSCLSPSNDSNAASFPEIRLVYSCTFFFITGSTLSTISYSVRTRLQAKRGRIHLTGEFPHIPC